MEPRENPRRHLVLLISLLLLFVVSPFAATLRFGVVVLNELYVAVLIARLVGLHIVHGIDSKSRDKN